MRTVQLVTLDPAIDKAVATDSEFLAALGAEDWAGAAAVVHRLLGRTLTADPVTVDELHWGGYFAVDAITRDVVGSCAFKTPPTADGTVEIAYFTYPEFAQRGYATAMARRLIEMASGSAEVQRVIAHTLMEENASTRVLKRVGMEFVGEVIDPDDGRVWRWQRQTGS